MAPTVPALPNAPDVYRFRSRLGEHVLLVPFGAIYDLADPTDDPDPLIRAALLDSPAIEPPLDQIDEPLPQSISLNVSNRCNLSCVYCYASGGNFQGAQDTPMTWDLAKAAVDRLLAGASRDAPVTIGFLGGEPFANRALIHDTVRYASGEGARLGFDVRFSVTSNATLLREEDIALLRRHPFAVTVSIDGSPAQHDQQRPRVRTGLGSWSLMAKRVAPLLAYPGSAKLAARATVTRDDLDVARRIEAITSLGFPEVGVSPLRVAANADFSAARTRLADLLRPHDGSGEHRARPGARRTADPPDQPRGGLEAIASRRRLTVSVRRRRWLFLRRRRWTLVRMSPCRR